MCQTLCLTHDKEKTTFNEVHLKMSEKSQRQSAVTGAIFFFFFSIYRGGCWIKHEPDVLEVIMERVGGSAAVPMTLKPEGNFITEQRKSLIEARVHFQTYTFNFRAFSAVTPSFLLFSLSGI